MPLVFASESPTLSDVDYHDIYGVQYEFPARYQSYIATGDQFVYYRGARAGQPAYLGHGIVGDVNASPKPNHFLALLHDVVTFDAPVPAKAADGTYLETGSSKNTNWANGVRRIGTSVFERIRQVGEGVPLPAAKAVSTAHASAMEQYSVAVVVQLLSGEFGPKAVSVMPVNNPGYDISVTTPTGELRVEVKGTVLPAPTFHLSEGQRLHAEHLQQGWRLYVVHAINVKGKTHAVTHCDGSQLPTAATLEPEAWRGVLQT